MTIDELIEQFGSSRNKQHELEWRKKIEQDSKQDVSWCVIDSDGKIFRKGLSEKAARLIAAEPYWKKKKGKLFAKKIA